MSDRRPNDYWFPAAWRGVASPGYLSLSRWHALVGELGALRAFSTAGPLSFECTLTDPSCKAGLMNMSLLTELSQSEQLDELQRFVVEELSRHERLVLMLFYAEGLGLEEIAEVLDLPDATVAELFSRTLASLRAHFG